MNISTEQACINLLGKHKILTSGEFINHLTQIGYSEDNSRQILNRLSGEKKIWRSENLQLQHNMRLYANIDYVNSNEFLIAAGYKLNQTTRHGFARCLTLLGKKYVLNKIDVLRILAVSPNELSSSGLQNSRFYKKELSGLTELGVQVKKRGTVHESIVSPNIPQVHNLDELIADSTQQLRVSAVVTRILAEYLRRQNILSWNRIEIPDPDAPYALFNQHVFSAYGFSYLRPLCQWNSKSNKPKPCPVLIDCYPSLCSLPQVQSFKQRIERATISGRSKLNTMSIIAAPNFDLDAWKFARSQGMWTVSLRQVFGDEALETMIHIEELLNDIRRNEDQQTTQSFNSITNDLQDLKANPVVVALRSIAFEALCGLILRSNGYEVELGRVVPWEDTTRDVDVFGIRGDELIVIECKAYHKKKSLLREDVIKFFTQTLPAIIKWLKKNNRHFTTCKGEIWTTGPLGNEARDALNELKRSRQHSWRLQRLQDMKKSIPNTIHKRSVELIDTISMSDDDNGLGEPC